MKIDKLVRNLIGTEKLGRGNEFAHFNRTLGDTSLVVQSRQK